MKNNFKKFAVAIAAIMTIGSVTLLSCEKEDSITKHETTPMTKVAPGNLTQQSGLIDILSVKRGKKEGEIFHKYCVGRKGVCWLWFGGLFLAEDYDFEENFPPCLAKGSEDSPFIKNAVAGVFAKLSVHDSIDLVFDYSCVDKNEVEDWISDLNHMATSINDTITFFDEEMLDSWGINNPIVVPNGIYQIRKTDSVNSQFMVRVPFAEVEK